MNPIRTILIGLIAVGCLGLRPAFGQDATEEEPPLLRGSNRALSFSFDELRLDGVDGGVGARWYVGQNTAIRGTLRLGVESTEDVIEGTSDTGRNGVTVGTTFMVEFHTRSFRRVSPYLGSGFGIGIDAYSQTRDFDGTNEFRQQRVKGSTLHFTVNAALGMEVFLTRSVSLAGEHLFEAVVDSGDEEYKDYPREGQVVITNRDIRRFDLGIGTSSLILSVYF